MSEKAAQTLIYDTPSSLFIRLVDFLGAPVIGINGADLNCHWCVADGSNTALLTAEFDWSEVAFVTLPGLYLMTINDTGVAANVLSNLGSWMLRIAPREDPDIAEAVIYAEISRRHNWDYLQRILGLSQSNYNLTPVETNSHGLMTQGTLTLYTDATKATVIDTYTVTVSYDPSLVLTEYEVLEA